MPAVKFGAGGFLEYNEQHKVLICHQCQYAVQKSAIDSHLLRHKIYRSERKQLLSSISRLELLEPHHVPLPSPESSPVNGIPISDGLSCNSCGHLTISEKRMNSHYKEVHRFNPFIPIWSDIASHVKLQTFFRGTKVRYFEVLRTDPPASNNGDSDNSEHNPTSIEREEEVQRSNPAETSQRRRSTESRAATVSDTYVTEFSLETMTYLHHFVTTVCLTLPIPQNPRPSAKYWQTTFVHLSLERHWLMCGLLALSSRRLAELTNNKIQNVHYTRYSQFFGVFHDGQKSIKSLDSNPGSDAVGNVESAKKAGELIHCLLLCANRSDISHTKYESSAIFELPSIISRIQSCVVTEPTVDQENTQNNDYEPQKGTPNLIPRQNKRSTRGGLAHGSPSTNIPSNVRTRLFALPSNITDRLDKPECAQDVITVLSAITALTESCEISFASDDTESAWKGVTSWLAKIGDHFHEMTLQRHPATLVVFAHWGAILVRRAERVGCWYLNGRAKDIVIQIARQLSSDGSAVLDLVESLNDMVDDLAPDI